MKVKGRSGDVDAAEYARDVAARVGERLLRRLEREPSDAELPPPEELVEAIGPLVNYFPTRHPNELAGLLSPFWTGPRTRQMLGIATPRALDSRRYRGSVLGVRSADGHLFYPVCQFQRRADGRAEVKPELVRVFRALRSFDSWSVGVLLRTPSPELGQLTPLDWVRQGRPSAPLENMACAVAREWAAGGP